MKIILTVIYLIAAGLALLAGVLFPQVHEWSYWAAGACAIHWILALIVAFCGMPSASRAAAWFWQTISAVICVALLLVWNLAQHNDWLMGAITVGCFTLIVTFVFSMILKSDGNAKA